MSDRTIPVYCLTVLCNKRGESYLRLPHKLRQSLGVRRGDIVEWGQMGDSCTMRFRAPNGSSKPKRSASPYFPKLRYRVTNHA